MKGKKKNLRNLAGVALCYGRTFLTFHSELGWSTLRTSVVDITEFRAFLTAFAYAMHY